MMTDSGRQIVCILAFLAIVFVGCRAPIPCVEEYWRAEEYYGNVEDWAYPWNPMVPWRRENVQRIHRNLYDVKLDGFEAVEARQNNRDYCWAACAQMVLNFSPQQGNRKTVDQETIVSKIKGKVGERLESTGSVTDIMRAIGGPFKNVYVSNGLPNMMVADICQNWPVIVGVREQDARTGHVLVLTEIRLSWGPRGEPIFHDVVLYDPDRKRGGPKRMCCAELKSRLVFAVHMRRY